MSSNPIPQHLPRAYGKYELLERLGTGGMAEVYKARLSSWGGFEKILVIKRMLPNLARQQRYVDLFVQEAKLAAQIQHRNVVSVFELGSVGEELYIAMEYVAGMDLAALLRHATKRAVALPIWFSVHVVSEVLSGLSVVHDLADEHGSPLGLVHQDATPSNIFLSNEGDIKLGDFGVAASARRGDGPRKASEAAGKVAYAAPEVVACRDVDRRADLFSVGIVLWECLTQRRLFGGRPAKVALEAITSGPRPPPSKYNPRVPAALDQVVLRALEIDRDRRFASASALQGQLAEFLPRLAPQAFQAEVRTAVEILLGHSKLGATPSLAPQPVRVERRSSQGSELPSFLESTPSSQKLSPYQMDPGRPSLPAPAPEPSLIIDSPDDRVFVATTELVEAHIDPAALYTEATVDAGDVMGAGHDTIPAPAEAPPAVLGPEQPPWALGFPIARTGDGNVIPHDGGYRGPRPFWLRESGGGVWGPCDYGVIARYLKSDPERGLRRYRLAGYQTAWVDLEVFAALSGQEALCPPRLSIAPRAEGSLRTRGLASILAEVWKFRLTGRLLIVGEDAGQPPWRELQFVEGAPVFAASDDPALQLPEILVRQGLLMPADVPVVLHEVLFRLEPIEQIASRVASFDLARSYASLMRERALEPFTWRSGSFALEEGTTLTRKTHKLANNALSFAFTGLTRSWSTRELDPALAERLRDRFRGTEALERFLPDLELSPEQLRVARELASGQSPIAIAQRQSQDRKLPLTLARALVELDLLAPAG